MRILFLGINTKVLDEGAKNVATNLSRHLSSDCDLMMMHQRDVVKPWALLRAMKFRPDVILSSHGPSVKTLWVLKLLRSACRPRAVACLATQPAEEVGEALGSRSRVADHFFVQSRKYHDIFTRAGCACSMFPNGVDTAKFQPRDDAAAKEKMRAHLGVGMEDKVALHIGPLNHNRNHELLMRLQKETPWQVVVIGSTTAPSVPEIKGGLEAAGVRVFQEYFPDINEVYAAADAYVFPVMDETGSIEMPLTVLEAMSCDKPVVSSRFRGLPDFLEGGGGMAFFSTWEELLDSLDAVCGKSGNREFVKDLDWANLSAKLEKSLNELVGKK